MKNKVHEAKEIIELLLDETTYPPQTLPHYTSRGCIARCEFCSEWMLHGPRYRQKSPLQAADEVAALQARHDAIRFYFNDSMLNGSLEWLERFHQNHFAPSRIVISRTVNDKMPPIRSTIRIGVDDF